MLHSKIHLKIAVLFFLILAPACLQTAIDAGKPVPADGIYQLKDVDKIPSIEGVPATAQLPPEIKQKDIQKNADIGFVVGTDGKVEDIKIKVATPDIFGKVCADAVAKWTFTPAMVNGQPVKCRLRTTFGGNVSMSAFVYSNRPSDYDKNPRSQGNPTPNATEEMVKKGCSATVAYMVNVDGTTGDVGALESTNSDFEKLIVEAVQQWRYTPAEKKGKPVACLMWAKFETVKPKQ